MQWYYSKNGTQLGPIEQDELIQKLTTGEVTATDLVWRECLPDWLPAGQISELTAAFRSAPQVMPTAGTAPQSPYAPPTAAPQAMSYAPPVPSNGKATASLVLGIVSTVTALCGCYGMIVAIPCGILAIVFGSQVRKAAATTPSLTGELGKVKAGVITGWIGISLSILITIALFAFYGWALSMASQQDPKGLKKPTDFPSPVPSRSTR